MKMGHNPSPNPNTQAAARLDVVAEPGLAGRVQRLHLGRAQLPQHARRQPLKRGRLLPHDVAAWRARAAGVSAPPAAPRRRCCGAVAAAAARPCLP